MARFLGKARRRDLPRARRPFINRFALFQTEENERWHGKEPDLPGFMRR